MKTFFFAIAILLLVNVSKQQDLDTTTSTVETTTFTNNPVNLNDFIELRKTVCGCDENIASTCLTVEQNQTESSFTKRVARSIETVSSLWSMLKSMANQVQTSPENQNDEKQQQQHQQSCNSVTKIKCGDSQRIQVIKADVTNADLTVCPASNLNVDPEQSACSSNRIQSTELAQKLCNDKNECNLSLDHDGFEAICGCSTQKYLDLIYMCVSQNNDQSDLKRSVRNKRQARGRGRFGGGRLRGLGYGGYGYGGYGGALYDYYAMSGYGVGFPRYGINTGFRLVNTGEGEGRGEGGFRGEGRGEGGFRGEGRR